MAPFFIHRIENFSKTASASNENNETFRQNSLTHLMPCKKKKKRGCYIGTDTDVT